jgi:outer membrane protein assembly factor BamB
MPKLIIKELSSLIILLFCVLNVSAQDWTDWRGYGRDGVWKESGVLQTFGGDTIPLKWSVPCGPGYSSPTVAEGKVYFMDRMISTGEEERVVCLDAGTGSFVWSFSYPCLYGSVGYPAGPRASVVISDGKAYALGTMGHLHCLNALTGAVIWKRDLNREYEIRMPIWGIAATPLITGGKVILQIGGNNGAGILALDRDSGKELWRAMDDEASYSAPMLIRQAGKQVAVVWTAEHLAGLDPGTGQVYWKFPFTIKQGLAISTPVLYKDYIFVSCFYNGSLLVKLNQEALTAEKVWSRAGENERKTDALHCVINTPVIINGYIYGLDSYGELRCLSLENGDRIWEDLSAVTKNRWANIHFIQNGEQTWMFNEHGELLITILSPKGLTVISRARLIEPSTTQLNRSGTGVTWSHPAFTGRHVFIRNDKRVACAYLGK